jgi:hypothetical protein
MSVLVCQVEGLIFSRIGAYHRWSRGVVKQVWHEKIGEVSTLKYRKFIKKEKISDFFQKALDKFRFL